MAGGALAWARAQPAHGIMEERMGRELQPSPVNDVSENTGARTWTSKL